jgi:hypothetical protein
MRNIYVSHFLLMEISLHSWRVISLDSKLWGDLNILPHALLVVWCLLLMLENSVNIIFKNVSALFHLSSFSVTPIMYVKLFAVVTRFFGLLVLSFLDFSKIFHLENFYWPIIKNILLLTVLHLLRNIVIYLFYNILTLTFSFKSLLESLSFSLNYWCITPWPDFPVDL